jgi:hypothetical protein
MNGIEVNAITYFSVKMNYTETERSNKNFSFVMSVGDAPVVKSGDACNPKSWQKCVAKLMKVLKKRNAENETAKFELSIFYDRK